MDILPGSEGHKMSIICWSWDGYTPGTSDICMTKLIGQLLELVCFKMIVIPKDMIMTWP